MNLEVQVIDRGHVTVLLHQLVRPDDDLMQAFIPLGAPVGRVSDRRRAAGAGLVCARPAVCAMHSMRMEKASTERSHAATGLSRVPDVMVACIGRSQRRLHAATGFRSVPGAVVACIGRSQRDGCFILKLGHDQCLPYLWNTSPRPQMTAAIMRMPTTPQRVEVLTVTRKDWSSEVSSFCALTVIA